MRALKDRRGASGFGDLHCDLRERCSVPAHKWRWGWPEIAQWIMRRWCMDTLIKGKLGLSPFGCCGFDERGLSDSISTCRYGRSFWWLTLWKGTQHQYQVTVLIFTLPRRLLWWKVKAFLAQASLLEVSQFLFLHMGLRYNIWRLAWAVKDPGSDQIHIESLDFGLLNPKQISHYQQRNISIRQVAAAGQWNAQRQT